MRVRALGHAGLAIDTGGTRVVCDPWFSPEGAFQASWFPYPSNESQLEHALSEPAAILISHEHMDHVDPWFLARLPKNVPVVCPRYPSPALRRKILAGGSRAIIELDPWEPLQIGGISVFFVSEESPMNHDSAMVIQGDDTTLLNMNDARMTPRQIRRIRNEAGGTIDLLFLQAAGASWYPICYEYRETHRRELARSKRLAKLSYVHRVMALCEPTMTFPFAGPPAFLDDELFWVNDQMGPDGIFPDQGQARAWLDAASAGPTELLLPGDAWDHETHRRLPDPEWTDFSFTERTGYLRASAEARRDRIQAVKERYPWPGEPLLDRFIEYFSRVLDMSRYFNEQVGIRVGFDISGSGGGRWAVDFGDDQRGVFPDLGDPQYVYRFESRWLPPLLAGEVPWEDFFLSCRFRAYRSPDVYSDHLLGLLKFAVPEALEAVERYEVSHRDRDVETFALTVDGVEYAVQRYCPHAGQDLAETGELLDGGVIRCAGHHYEFDLATGDCLNGRSRPLVVKRLTP